ncbi:MAG: amylo-alpha-1,6-glucosidase [Abditibacteriales bacterium]|nr:amylo-alpha-1,6-glucosidase [Abditibacteriales bacterium]MDW8366489.1 amylo-alpha-1,6-glucosidase [Abditibacteriales bacterium]
MLIQFGEDVCSDFAQATQKEWLETNGLGGFASSTIVGANTRRYHGLLVAALEPPVKRFVLLSKLEESLIIGDERKELSCNQYRDAIHPHGYLYLESFRLDPFPTFTYRVGNVTLEKTVFMVHGENTTVVTYHLLKSPEPILMEIRPLLAYRDYHATTQENADIYKPYKHGDGWIKFSPYYGLPPLYLANDAIWYEPTNYWYRDFYYERETERGLDDCEDLFNPGILIFRLGAGETRSVIASLQPHTVGEVPHLREREVERRKKVVSLLNAEDDLVQTLALAADQFLVRRGNDLRTIIAGYPWFSDWGRDTMIALPGLTLVTKRFEEARSILRTFAQYCSQGMLPNHFPDAGGEPGYNTADATLWFFVAAQKYLDYTGDENFVQTTLYPVMADIIRWHQRGTRYNIHVDADGLLVQGTPHTQLTWMDAKIGDWVVTPRNGKAVEINALWYNALRIMEDWARRFDKPVDASDYREAAQRVEAHFERTFWNEALGCLFDCVDGDRYDASVRPNQIFALSLPYTLLSREKQLKVLQVVGGELLTPYGLRSLSPRSAGYVGRYEGNQWQRDGAYHQGTVWAWLMGPFITAYVKVHRRTPKAKREAAAFIEPLRAHLLDAGLGSISEIFDGDPPHAPKGCIAQAWSVAEILRAYVEDVKS